MREATNEEQRLMIVGGFTTLEEYLEWMRTPLPQEILDQLDEAVEAEELEEELMIEFGMRPNPEEPDEEELEFMEQEED